MVEENNVEKAMNDLQREVFIYKTLCELTVDLTVCKLMCDDPLKEWKVYLEKFKKEIDRLYEKVCREENCRVRKQQDNTSMGEYK